jgi:hypothetical protein
MPERRYDDLIYQLVNGGSPFEQPSWGKTGASIMQWCTAQEEREEPRR